MAIVNYQAGTYNPVSDIEATPVVITNNYVPIPSTNPASKTQYGVYPNEVSTELVAASIGVCDGAIEIPIWNSNLVKVLNPQDTFETVATLQAQLDHYKSVAELYDSLSIKIGEDEEDEELPPSSDEGLGN